MRKNGRKTLALGIAVIFMFAIWTLLIQTADVKPLGQNGTNIGFAALNIRFFRLTGVHMTLYTVTDWFGLVPLVVCMTFGMIGFVQMIRRKSLLKVDVDIILLGVYYIIVIFGYLIFEMIPINYRPIPIDGRMEASYPSSTTLLVLSVMPTLIFQIKRRVKSVSAANITVVITAVFSAFMVIGRLVSGVHWFTDILGGVLLSGGLFYIYKGAVLLCEDKSVSCEVTKK